METIEKTNLTNETSERIEETTPIKDNERVATIFFSKDRQNIRIEDSYGKRISLPASGPRDQYRVEIQYASGHHFFIARCGCRYVWGNGKFELRTPNNEPCPHY